MRNAISWGLPRLAIGLGIIVFVPAIAYVLVVIAVVTGQAVQAFGQ